jgi:type IV pilus secretin PilQ/predicted competence protein
MRSKTSFPSIRWTILILLLWLQALSSQAMSQAGSAALLQDLTFKSNANQTVVVLKANRAFDYTSYYPNPRLFILDIPAAQSRLEQNSIAIKTSLVDFATITHIGEGQRYLVRIEFNLNQPIQYALHNEGSNLQISFSSTGSPEVIQTNDTSSAERKSAQLKPVSEEGRAVTAKAVTAQEPATGVLPPTTENPSNPPSAKDQAAKANIHRAESQTLINDVTIEEDGQQLKFTLQTTSKPSFRHFQLDGPKRLVIDVDSSSFKISQRAVEVHSDLIQRIRFGYGDSQRGKLVRCVFDLNRKAAYKISGTDSGLVIQFTKEANPAAQVAQDNGPSRDSALSKEFENLEDSPELSPAAAPMLNTRTVAPEILADTRQIALPQLLATLMTAPVIEGTVSLSEIEISRRDETKVPDQPLQLAELLPPVSFGSESGERPFSEIRETITSQDHEPASSKVAGSDNSPVQTASLPVTQSEALSSVSQLPLEKRDPIDSNIRDLLSTKTPEASMEILPRGDDAVLFAQVSTASLPALGIPVAPVAGQPIAPPATFPVSKFSEVKNETKPQEGDQPTEPAAKVEPELAKPAAVLDQVPVSHDPVTEPRKVELEMKPSKPVNQASTAYPVAAPQLVKRIASPALDKISKAKGPEQELAFAQQPAPAITAVPVVAPLSVNGAKQGGSQVIAQVTTSQSPKYSGESFTLELKDADLKDFFRLIGDFSGLNVVLDPDVKGNLTIFLKDVPWDQALDVVLKNNGLGKQLEGNILRIATNQSLEGEEAQRKRLADARILSAELQTETRVLNYAKAADLSQVLKKILSPRGDIIVDSRTNSMIISDVPGKFSAIDALIRQLDKKIKQVEIEARVISATRDFLRDIGVQIGAVIGNNAQNKLSGAIPGDPFSRNPPPSVTIQPGQSGGATNSIPLISNLGANAATSGLAFFGGFTRNVILDTIITAAERRGTAKLLSKPKIITQENIEGFVQQGVKIPVQTTINNTVSVQFFDFALKLRVTPQITDEGTISMVVNVENSTPDFSRQVQGVPTVNTQETRTTVLVDNGGTVVIGGVLVDNEQTNLRQVPGVGNIPLIGNLFKNRSVTKQTQELIFFISPKIL